MSSEDSVISFIRDRFTSLERSIEDGFNSVNANIKGHDERIRSLEQDRVYRKGKLVVYSSIGGALITVLGIIIGAAWR